MNDDSSLLIGMFESCFGVYYTEVAQAVCSITVMNLIELVMGTEIVNDIGDTEIQHIYG